MIILERYGVVVRLEQGVYNTYFLGDFEFLPELGFAFVNEWSQYFNITQDQFRELFDFIVAHHNLNQ